MKDNYVYEGTNVLINVSGINDQDKPDNYETTMANIVNIICWKKF